MVTRYTSEIDTDFRTMLNSSGGSVGDGDTVVWTTTASGDAFTTTTTAGDDQVCGMVEETIANGARGRVRIAGKTTAMKVNGLDDISIGDLLCAFTTAKIAAKAGVGDMAHAVALDHYTDNDSLGVLDAILITPRKV